MALRTAWSPRVGHSNLAFNRKEGLDTASCAIDGSENKKRTGPRGRKHNFNEKPLPCTWPVIGCAVLVLLWTFLNECCPNPTKPLSQIFLSGPSPIIGNPCHSLTHWPFSRLYWCDPVVWRCQLKTCWGCNCADVDAEKCVDDNLVQIWKLKFGNKVKFLFRL